MQSYTNVLDTIEVSVAIERLLIAPYGTTWNPARISLDSLPPGFFDLGAVVEDTPSFYVTVEKFELRSGVPAVLQYQSTTNMEGTLDLTLRSNSWRKFQYSLGNYTPVSSAFLIGDTTAEITAGATNFTLVSTTSSLCVGQRVVLVGSESPDASDAFETHVTSFSGTTVYIDPPAIKDIDDSGEVHVYGYSRVNQHVGGRQILKYTLLGVADFIDGTQIVHEIFLATASQDSEEAFRPNQEGRIPLSFDIHGIEKIIRGCSELVVADRHFFPPKCGTCAELDPEDTIEIEMLTEDGDEMITEDGETMLAE